MEEILEYNQGQKTGVVDLRILFPKTKPIMSSNVGLLSYSSLYLKLIIELLGK